MTATTHALAGLGVLTDHHDAMVAHMEQLPGVDHHEADLAITQWWDRCVNRLVAERGFEHAQAEYVMDAGVGFLYRTRNDDHCVPTPAEDDGWHVMLPYTAEYAAFSYAIAGRFLHHRPNDVIGAMTHCDCPGGHQCDGDGHCQVSKGKCGGVPPCAKCDH
jgi:hypothetical protein